MHWDPLPIRSCWWESALTVALGAPVETVDSLAAPTRPGLRREMPRFLLCTIVACLLGMRAARAGKARKLPMTRSRVSITVSVFVFVFFFFLPFDLVLIGAFNLIIRFYYMVNAQPTPTSAARRTGMRVAACPSPPAPTSSSVSCLSSEVASAWSRIMPTTCRRPPAESTTMW